MIAVSSTVRANGPGLIQRRGEGDDAPARAAAIGRLHADDAAESRRLADRAAGIGASAPGAIRAATAAAEPPEEPPGTSGRLSPCRFHGLSTGPKALVMLDEPIANSSRLALPSITAPSRHNWR